MPPKPRAASALTSTVKATAARRSKESPATATFVNALRKAGAPELSNRARAARVAVVSEELCDDALKLLAPSLAQYKGCNIIDINPGAGLWSSKVHDFLKPRSHLLVEPNKKVYHSALKVLLDKPDSKYQFIHKTFMATNPGEFDEGAEQLLAHLSGPQQKEDIETTAPTLVLATLTTLPPGQVVRRAGARGASPSEPFMYAYAAALVNRTGFHSRGPLRILVWVLDSDKFSIQPRSVNGRGTPLPRLEDCAQITEIVGSTQPPFRKRNFQYEVCSAISAAQRMKESGIVLPDHRSSELHKAAMRSLEDVKDGPDEASELVVAGKPLPRSSSLVQKLEEMQFLEHQVAIGNFKKTVRKLGLPNNRRTMESPEYARLCALRAEIEGLVSSVTDVWRTERIRGLVPDEIALAKAEAQSVSASLTPAQRSAAAADALALIAKLKVGKRRISDVETLTLDNVVDNCLALRQSPPLLTFDQRACEPLSTEAHEFYPATKLALLDIVPHASTGGIDFVALADHPLLRCLRTFNSQDICTALTTIAYGSPEVLLPQCPSITDPAVGGRVHPENLRVRMLTPQMQTELCRAWDKWPFKPEEEQLRFTFNLKRWNGSVLRGEESDAGKERLFDIPMGDVHKSRSDLCIERYI